MRRLRSGLHTWESVVKKGDGSSFFSRSFDGSVFSVSQCQCPYPSNLFDAAIGIEGSPSIDSILRNNLVLSVSPAASW